MHITESSAYTDCTLYFTKNKFRGAIDARPGYSVVLTTEKRGNCQ